jgi:hypothetical protein
LLKKVYKLPPAFLKRSELPSKFSGVTSARQRSDFERLHLKRRTPHGFIKRSNLHVRAISSTVGSAAHFSVIMNCRLRIREQFIDTSSTTGALVGLPEGNHMRARLAET